MKSPLASPARSARAWSIGLILLLAAACTDKAAKARAVADSDLARDLALAGTQTAAPQATFQDTSVAPAPTPASHVNQEPPAPVRTHTSHKPRMETPTVVRQSPPPPTPTPTISVPAPTAAPLPAPEPAHAEIGAGTGVGMTGGSKVCTNSLPGDKMVATVNSAVTGSNGAVIPAGSAVVLEVASVNQSQNGDPQIAFRVKAVVINDKTYPVDGDVTTATPLEKSQVSDGSDRNKVIGGAIAGALIGQIIGHNTKGTLIGAAAGAATGAAVAKAHQSTIGCLPSGAQMKLTINSPIVMS
jgi:hypothetical protein